MVIEHTGFTTIIVIILLKIMVNYKLKGVIVNSVKVKFFKIIVKYTIFINVLIDCLKIKVVRKIVRGFIEVIIISGLCFHLRNLFLPIPIQIQFL